MCESSQSTNEAVRNLTLVCVLMRAAGAKIEKKQVLQPSIGIMSQPQKDRTHTSFPEKVKRHKVQHGVLDVVDLFFKWELPREELKL